MSFKCWIYIFKYLSRTRIGLLKFKDDEKKFVYLDKYKSLKDNYKNNVFLNSFLKEISIISYDYTDKLIKVNNSIHIVTNMNNKYIYPALVSINSVLRNSNKNKTTIVYHILCPDDLRRRNINKLKSLLYI